MKKYISLILMFLIPLFIIIYGIEILILFGVKKSEIGQTGKVNQLFLRKINYDIVVFGASNGEVGFNSNLFSQLTGKTAFNMSIDGTDVSQYADLIYELCDYSSTREVIIALPPNGMFEAKLPTEINRYIAWLDNKYINQNEIYHNYESFWKIKHIPFYKLTVFNSNLYKTSAYGWSNYLLKSKSKSCYNNNGWSPINVKWGERNSTLAVNDSIKLLINPKSLLIMEKIIMRCKESKKKIKFIIMPAEKSAFERFSNYEDYKSVLRNLTSKHKITLIDFNRDSTLISNRDYFYNYTHLNVEGSKILTSEISKLYY